MDAAPVDATYWDGFYARSDQPAPRPRSSFADYVSTHLLQGLLASPNASTDQTRLSLIDLGCGNGRDSLFFASLGLDVTACDSSREALALVSAADPRPALLCRSIADLDDTHSFDIAYSRFSLHALTSPQQDRLFAWAAAHASYFCIETRSVFDPRAGKGSPGRDPGAWIDTHYRRFTRLDDLVDLARRLGFDVIRSEIEWRDAWFADDHAVVNRLILRCPQSETS